MVVLLVIYVPNIKEVFGLAGASVATMLVIIMPAGFYYLVSSMTHADASFLDVISRGRTHLDLVTLPLIFFLARARGKNINEEKNQFGCCWFRRRFCNFLNWINHLRMVPPTHS